MRLIVGLGNPGEKYSHTRHNVGFDVIDILSQKLDIPVKKLKCRATIGEGMLGGEKIVLIKPQTFMNLSGLTVSDALSWYKAEPKDMLLIVDDIDLPLGQVRIRAKGGPGTHNGLRHIVQCTGTGDFPRVRVGVGAPPPEWDLADWVLSKYADEAARKTAFDAYMLAAEAALCWAEHGIDLAMNRHNKRHAE
ncbi:MAG: aminoacyl-tRNA hydrolase [Clostridia bacterium]|nr:aminoacyl-tRNA hydrolase [Clostridiales bacterium]MBQ2978248.1 aminoacyl-tRNA hydrolase [Clostridia bacterium]